jgi:Asp-tRNA(Asn)/Glu-tRNA(Gln) amidotransferase A subunit family amidase
MLCRLPLTRMAAMVRQGEVTSLELVEAHLRQIEERNPAINAFTMVLAESAREQASAVEPAAPGLLRGVPVTVKDSFDVEGLPSLVGSRGRIGHRAARDAAAVARLRRHGAIVLGKTNTPEMLRSYETANEITGRTSHPLNAALSPGGSSGGEAAAIAAFCSPGGIGSDGGGSLRFPAHLCGIAGFKPTPGRISGVGHTPPFGYPAGLIAVAGPIARSAEDIRLLFQALAGYDAEDPFSAPVPLRTPDLDGVRIGVWEQFYSVPVDPAIRRAVQAAARAFADAGFAVETLAPTGLERAPNAWAGLFNPWTVGGEEIAGHLIVRDRLRASLIRQMENVAAIVMPVCNIVELHHGQTRFPVDGSEIGIFQATMPLLLANVLGLPAMAAPFAGSSVQLLGKPYDDELLIELAVRLEKTSCA